MRASDTDNQQDPRLAKILKMTQFPIIMELDAGHWCLDWSHKYFSSSTTLAFQWAISTEHNEGCRKLVESGRAVPLYPPDWRKTFAAFLAGNDNDQHGKMRQLSLGI